MSEFLKRAQLANHHGMAQVNVRSRRVSPVSLAEAGPCARLLQFGPQLILRNDIDGAFAEVASCSSMVIISLCMA